MPTVKTIFANAKATKGDITVRAVGHQWWWEFRYPGVGVITANELQTAKTDPCFHVAVVTEALSRKAQVAVLTGERFLKDYSLAPISYAARPRPQRAG